MKGLIKFYLVETDKDGLVVEVLDYYPFGSVRTDTKPTAYENDKKFTGYELDSTGLYYAGQKYYTNDSSRDECGSTPLLSADRVILAKGLFCF